MVAFGFVTLFIGSILVSPKSVIVASDMKVAETIQSELLQYGIGVQVARIAGELGLCLNPGGKRSTAGIQTKKLKVCYR